MSTLDVFALVVLIILALAAAGIWVMLGMWPGKIARQRQHPQADAIGICGWWGVITLGLLLPLAWIWAYTNPSATLKGTAKPEASGKGGDGK
jgi:H+/Cl- antiporter ClcA